MNLQDIAKELQGLYLQPLANSNQNKSNSEIFHTYAEIIRSEFRSDFCACTVEIEITDCNIFALEKWLKSHLRGKKISHFGNWLRVEKI